MPSNEETERKITEAVMKVLNERKNRPVKTGEKILLFGNPKLVLYERKYTFEE